MKTQFDKFINEYGGPGRTIGFKYSEPSNKYIFSICAVINPDLDTHGLEKEMKKMLKSFKAEEDYLKVKNIGADSYEIKIAMKAYSKYEVLAMAKEFFKAVFNKYGKGNIIFITDSIQLGGIDIKDWEKEQIKRDSDSLSMKGIEK